MSSYKIHILVFEFLEMTSIFDRMENIENNKWNLQGRSDSIKGLNPSLLPCLAQGSDIIVMFFVALNSETDGRTDHNTLWESNSKLSHLIHTLHLSGTYFFAFR